MSQTGISPREFLKERRPEKFSDSVSQELPTLDRSLLEYHLETLTSRSQENDFENFARRLAEQEICPNLLPHTGPTGGGDSKVDAETYPVAGRLSFVWFTGSDEAAHERWAFAFSAQKKWRPKIESDVDKIVATNRAYQKIFFVTNQFIADRVRAEVEDKLRTKHRIDVRILDRTWILDRVFSNKREALAITELRIKTDVRVHRRVGPLDAQKERGLEEVEIRIKETAEHGPRTPALADDCLRAVELARGLERPRTDVEGRLVRLKRVTEDCGTSHQRFLAEYAWAWTAFWWFEDYTTFLEHYSEAEKRATGTTNVYQIELLFNLWCNLQMAARSGKVSPDKAKLAERTQTLTAELERLKQEEGKPSSALQAETLALLMNLITTPQDQSDEWLKRAADVIDRSTGLVGFPFEPLIQILTEFGKFVGDSPAYDALHDKLIDAVATRKGDEAAARLLVQRAAQALDDNRPYVAIQSAGKALGRLYKHETRHELIEALYICGNAYDKVGLTWAARGTVLTAASVAVNEFWTYDQITPEQAICFGRLRWFELRLGRLPHCLVWHQTTQAAEAVLRHKGGAGRRALEQTIWFDICLAILLLKADLWELNQLSRLPDTLDTLELHLSAATLRFALGHEYHLPEGLAVRDNEKQEFFKKLRTQPAAEQMPESPLLYSQQRVALGSRILGCSITVTVDNRPPCPELAESLLAALEALLATGVEHRLFAHEPQLAINIRRSDFASFPFRFDFLERDDCPYIEIAAADFHPHKMSRALQYQLQDKLTELLIRIIARFFIVEFSEERLKDFLGDELALERAVNFTTSFVNLGNVLGHTPKTTLDSWIDENQGDYSIKRAEDWDADERRALGTSSTKSKPVEPRAAVRTPNDDWQATAGHTEMETVSLIRIPLWEKAKWAGMAYLWDRTNQSPPAIALAFSDGTVGREIFAHWQKEIGTVDTNERLQLSIIRAISKRNVHAYRVMISANPKIDALSTGTPKLLFMMSRIHTMEPSSDANLRAFLENYRAVGSFLLMPALSRGSTSPPELFYDRGILKRDIQVRDAWQIGPNDPDAAALRDDDDPIIPDGQDDAPVLRALKWLRNISQQSGDAA
jgi:hypothetical protein